MRLAISSNGKGFIKSGGDPWSSRLFFPVRSLTASCSTINILYHIDIFFWDQHLHKVLIHQCPQSSSWLCSVVVGIFLHKQKFTKAQLISEYFGLFFTWSVVWVYRNWALLNVVLREFSYIFTLANRLSLLLKLLFGPRVRATYVCKF